MNNKKANIFYYIPHRNTLKVVIAGPKGDLRGGMTTKCLNISRRRKKNWQILILFFKFFFKTNRLKFRSETTDLTIRYKGCQVSVREVFFLRAKLFRFFQRRGLKPQSFELITSIKHNGCRARKCKR